jgi:hypothetical protein
MGFMDLQFIGVAVQLFLGSAATILAIALVAQNRDAAWVCIFVAILSNLVGTLYSTLLLFGVRLPWDAGQFTSELLQRTSLTITGIVLNSLTWLFICVAVIVRLVRRHRGAFSS